MDESLTQPRRVSEEGLRVVKLCHLGKTARWGKFTLFDGTRGGSTGKLCASSRGNTEGASVVRNYWA
jgi:hypothetical protein